MSIRIKVEVPPTMEMGSYKFFLNRLSLSWGYHETQTLAQAALQDYNHARDHDGLPPLKKMPRGTKYYREETGRNSDGTANYLYIPIR